MLLRRTLQKMISHKLHAEVQLQEVLCLVAFMEDKSSLKLLWLTVVKPKNNQQVIYLVLTLNQLFLPQIWELTDHQIDLQIVYNQWLVNNWRSKTTDLTELFRILVCPKDHLQGQTQGALCHKELPL